MYIKTKLNRFNEIFTVEEKAVIIIGSIVTIIAIIMIWVLVFNLLFKLTAPVFIKAANALIGALFEGWTL